MRVCEFRSYSYKPTFFYFFFNMIAQCCTLSSTHTHTLFQARAANRIGSDNPRFKGENILGLQFDLPQRTTRDYDEREMFDDGGLGFSVGNIPNVYLAYPSSSDMGGYTEDVSVREDEGVFLAHFIQCFFSGQDTEREESKSHAPLLAFLPLFSRFYFLPACVCMYGVFRVRMAVQSLALVDLHLPHHLRLVAPAALGMFALFIFHFSFFF